MKHHNKKSKVKIHTYFKQSISESRVYTHLGVDPDYCTNNTVILVVLLIQTVQGIVYL